MARPNFENEVKNMKVKALTDCTGIGYENFTAGESRDVRKGTAELLISFGYAERVEKPRPENGEGKEPDGGEGKESDGEPDGGEPKQED